MKRVETDGLWSLFDPKDVPAFPDVYGDDFVAAYEEAEVDRLFRRQVKARDLYAKMMRSLAQTGNGWMTFKDATNLKCNETGKAGNVVHLSNLCTEITKITSKEATAVCNLGSNNLARHVTHDEDGNAIFDFEKLGATVRTAVPMLDRVIDINYYPIAQAANSNAQWRPIGLGIMGLQDVFFQLRLPLDSSAAMALSTRIQEEIYYHALEVSCRLAEKDSPHASFAESQFAEDLLSGGVAGLSVRDMRQYLGYVADSRLQRLGMAPVFQVKNPFSFMELQDVQSWRTSLSVACLRTRPLLPEKSLLKKIFSA